MKRLAAFCILLIIVLGWYVSLAGLQVGGTRINPIGESLRLGLDLKGGVYVVLEAKTDVTGAELKKIMQQTQGVIERRVNELGLSEPIVTIEGENRLRVELPGADNAEQAVEIIGRTAQLAFMKPDGTVAVMGDQVKDASITTDTERGGYAVALSFNAAGADAFAKVTAELARASGTQMVESAFGQMPANVLMIVLDDQVISAPRVSEALPGGNAIITGGFTDKEAGELAALIRGGALPVPLEEVQSSLIGPTLGMDTFQDSVKAGIIGVCLIFVFMVAMYKLMGMAANIALLLYIIIVLWITAGLGAVLTLPGIAGMILSVGMAVDSNVIIFSKIQEEVEVHGKSIRVAVSSGFHRAFNTIIDTHITTIITGVLLYQMGSGPVRGFAATLLIGIVASLFTAVVVTQLFLVLFAESKMLGRNKKVFGSKMLHLPKPMLIVKNRRIFYIVSAALIVIGIGFGMIRGFNFGMDFTGGSMIQIDMGREVTVEEIKNITKANGIEADVLHAGEGNEQIIIRTQQALQSDARDKLYQDIFEEYELDKSNIVQTEMFGPSVGETLRKSAVRATVLAAAGILLYIAFRFEWKFGVAAIVALFHDVLIMIAVYGVFRIPINAPFIASMLIIFGYSVSDTVVIFDRIRENLRIEKKMKADELIDLSINQTVIRSLATSVTTVLAISILFFMGASSIKEFTLPLLIGILAGAASSIFIASPIWYELVQLTRKSKYRGK